RAGARNGARHIERQRIRLARRHAPPALGGRDRLARPRIERGAVWIAWPLSTALALGNKRGDLGTAFEARVDEFPCIEPRQRAAIVGEMHALPPHRLLPGDAEPAQILIDRLLVFRPAARRLDV